MVNQRISPMAEIGENNVFGHDVIIGPDVVIGDNNVIEDNTRITGKSIIGSGNYIGAYNAIGVIPTDMGKGYELERPLNPSRITGRVEIGDNNVIREFTNVDLPTLDVTSIGNNCYIAQHCAIAHDVLLEDGVILTNHCSPGGHAKVLAGANLGKGVQTHQRTVIGQCAMIGVGAVIIRHVLPGVTSAGNPGRFLGVNKIGLERHGFDQSDIEQFTEILTSEPDAGPIERQLNPKVDSTFSHFQDVLSKGRDTRTLPAVTLPTPLTSSSRSRIAG